MDTAGDTTTVNKDSLGVETSEDDSNKKIKLPEEILITRLEINFGTNQEICEIIVAGISASK